MFEYHWFTDFVYLATVLNPFSLVPVFLHVTEHLTPKARRRTALRAVVIAATILIGFVVLGQILLEALGIGLPSFTIGGGLILLAIALQRILAPANVSADEKAGSSLDRARDVAVFPLATPYIAGPGAIVAVVLLTDNDKFTIAEQALTTLIMLAIVAFLYAVLLGADTVHRLLGTTGADVIDRISALILAALAVDTIIEGLYASFSLA
jgi:multiple antibiotic resistance protein